jgi:hypothetical protein
LAPAKKPDIVSGFSTPAEIGVSVIDSSRWQAVAA